MSEFESNSLNLFKIFNQKNILIRILVVLTRPSLLFSIAYFDQSIAGIIGFYFIVSSITTSSLSFAYYKKYIPDAVQKGLMYVRSNVFKHTSLVGVIILLSSFLLELNPWIPCSLIFEFYLHQIARVYLYRKEFWYWCIYSALIPFLFILFYFIFINASESTIIYFYFFSLSLFIISIFLIKPYQFLKEIYEQNILFGLNRKLLIQLDKLIIGLMIDPSLFWILAIMYQVSNAGTILFDTLIVMPNKNKIVKNTFKYEKNKLKKINFQVSILSLLILLVSTLLIINEDYSFFIALCFLLCQRIYFLNILNLSLELYFWKFNLSKITRIMTVFISVIFITSYLALDFIYPKEIGILFTTIFFSAVLYIIDTNINKKLKSI